MCEISEKIYQEGIERGMALGKLESKKETARSLSKIGMPLEEIAEVLTVNASIVQEWLIGNTTKTI